jgi:hypothetical protein
MARIHQCAGAASVYRPSRDYPHHGNHEAPSRSPVHSSLVVPGHSQEELNMSTLVVLAFPTEATPPLKAPVEL